MKDSIPVHTLESRGIIPEIEARYTVASSREFSAVTVTSLGLLLTPLRKRSTMSCVTLN